MRVSVVLATYRSGEFLSSQVRSVVDQTHSLDEILIVDDASADGTGERAMAMLAGHGGARLCTSESNVGITKNFERGLRSATGDIVFLCDHDDIWHPNKVSDTLRWFASHQEALMVFSDARIVDGAGQIMPGHLWQRVLFDEKAHELARRGKFLSVLAKKTVVTGAAAAFRRELLELALPFPELGWHDSWLALIAEASRPGTGLGFTPAKLIDYRIHGSNAAGVPDGSLAARWAYRHHGVGDTASELAQWRALQRRIESPEENNEVRMLIQAKIDHLGFRARLPQARRGRVLGVWQESRRHGYKQFADGYKTAVSDLIRPA